MTKDIWEDEDEFYDHLEEAWSWYSPTSTYRYIQDPTAENFAKAAWVPTLSLGTYMGFNYAMLGQGGMPHLSFWSANVWQSRLSTLRWASGGLATGARYGAHLGRGALRHVGFLGVMASLPWLYENAVVPGAEVLIDYLWPGLDQLKFGQDQ
jgi:hypothetical protein